MRRSLLCFFSCIPLLVFAESSDEELARRRIQTLCQEKDYAFAKKAIEEFLDRFPTNPASTDLTLLLIDIALQEEDLRTAKELFSSIPREHFTLDDQKKLWRILLRLGEYDQLRDETKKLINNDLEARFCFAQASLRLGLSDKKKKESLLEEALEHFQLLKKETTYILESESAIVTILKELSQEAEAQGELKNLARHLEERKEMNEEILLFAATHLAKNDPSLAKTLLTRLIQKGEKKKREGALLLFSLLTKTKDIESLTSFEREFSSHLSTEHLALYYYLIGKSFSERKAHSQAIASLEKSLELCLSSPYDKEALLRLGRSAFASGDMDTLKKASLELTKRYPKESSDISKLELALASLYSKKGQNDEALSLIDKAIEKGTLPEEAMIEKVKILSNNQSFESGHMIAKEYLEKHPKSKRMIEAHLALLSSWAQHDFSPLVQEKIAIALEKACESVELLNRDEKADLYLALARSLLNAGKPKRSISLLESLLEEGESSPEIYLYLAAASLKDERTEKFISYGERALLLEVDQSQRLHLPLFNAYLTLAKERRDSALENKAAKHLLAAIQLEMPISLENRLWLFHRMSREAKENGVKSEIDAAIALVEPMIHDDEGKKRLGKEVIEVARLYNAKGNFEKAMALLERLKGFESDLSWKNQDETLLCIAETLFYQKKEEESLQLYLQLEESDRPEIAAIAALKASRLAYLQLPEEKKKKESSEVKAILAKLKELKIKKAAFTEPVHIEAALDFAEILSHTYSKSEREKKLLVLLEETKKEFLSEEDLVAKDYHEGLKQAPEKGHLVDSYLRYLDSWIYTVEGSLSKRKEERAAKEKMASLLLSSLKQEAPRYVREKAALLEETLR